MSLLVVSASDPCLNGRSSCMSTSRSHAAVVLLLGSMHSLVASPYKSAYNAAKHGIAGFTKTVALETAQARLAPTPLRRKS